MFRNMLSRFFLCLVVCLLVSFGLLACLFVRSFVLFIFVCLFVRFRVMMQYVTCSSLGFDGYNRVYVAFRM